TPDRAEANGFDRTDRTAKRLMQALGAMHRAAEDWQCPDCSFGAKSTQRPYWWFRPSVVQVDGVGFMPNRESTARSRFVRRSLEWPQTVSGCLMSAATYNQPSRIAGASWRCSASSSLEADPRDLDSAGEALR